MITSDALQLLIDTSQESQKAEIIHIDAFDFIKRVRIGNTLHEISVSPAPIDHCVHTLKSLIDYSEHLEDSTKSQFWVSDDYVTLLLDKNLRHENVTMPLSFTKPFMLLRDLSDKLTWYNQNEFVRMLRLVLGVDSTITAKFRRLAWSSDGKSTAEHMHGSDKIGKSINSQLENSADIPEKLELEILVYDQFSNEKRVVSCAIEIDSRNQMIALIPLPNEINRVISVMKDYIFTALVEDKIDIPVYYGSP